MKLQVPFDFTDLNQALKIAGQIEDSVDIFEIGAPLIFKEGISAIKEFRKYFPDKKIFADAKIVDRVKSIINILKDAGADHISVLAGTSNQAIQKATKIAHDLGIKVALDLLDAYSMGQSAMDAKSLDADMIIFHKPHESRNLPELLEEWESVRGNTNLPIFFSGGLDKNNIEKVIELKPDGIIIGSAITQASNPEEEAAYFKSLLK